MSKFEQDLDLRVPDNSGPDDPANDFAADASAVMAEIWSLFAPISGEWSGVKDWREAARIIRSRDSEGKA